ncbi:MAG: YkgJ family cysteine cluster protein [Polyangiaceae bacterium]
MAEMHTLEFDFALDAETFHVKAEVPIAPVRPRRLLPVFQQMSNMIVDSAVAKVEARGEAISCKAGCGACCRQIVPISGAEARQIREMVATMPEPRRTEVRARFTDAIDRLKAAGLYEKARDSNTLPDEEDVPFALGYMKLGIACPFLEDESCSIHPDRPVICREYLVTSDPADCADPTGYHVRPVPMRARLSRGVVALESRPEGPVLLPLVMALEWAEANERNEPKARPARKLLEVVMEVMARPREDGQPHR